MPSPYRPDLDPHYYLNHFHEMLAFVEDGYNFALAEAHHRFINDFDHLSRDAQCVYVRMANRKGKVFPASQLNYDEISNSTAAAAELSVAGFLRPADASDTADILSLRTRAELVQLLRDSLSAGRVRELKLSAAKKADLISSVAVELSPAQIVTALSAAGDSSSAYWVQLRSNELAYLLYLYFGKTSHSLNSFTMRDLGLMKTQQFQQEFSSRFTDKEAALTSFFFATKSAALKSASHSQLLEQADGVDKWPATADPDTAELRYKAIHRLGRSLERAGEKAAALQVYLHSDQFPGTERAVRLLMLSEHGRQQAEQRLLQMIDEPSCDEELFFAEDFYRRKFKKARVGRLTNDLRNARVYHCDETGRGHAEASVIAQLAREGFEGYHVENAIWRQLFGLLFWDFFYGEQAQALHNEFDFFPQELARGTFYNKHSVEINQRLKLLTDRAATAHHLLKVATANHGKANALVAWWPRLFERTLQLVELAPADSLAAVLLEMTRDYKNARHGFPDLMLVRDGVISFLEVKAEGDQIRRHQLVQIERLRRAGFQVAIARVEWTIDPMQSYVVIDVETTGGRAQSNRVTEIGAVRVIGNEIVDEFSTLVNPERRIPANITRITGITDRMVAAAPLFADVADELRQFIGDSIFVAHNVNFDYGFIREEYRRLDQQFFRPKLCTVSSSRKFFPGYASYSLANLCREFDIRLESHHRALCDAKAAAEILIAVNSRRLSTAKAA